MPRINKTRGDTTMKSRTSIMPWTPPSALTVINAHRHLCFGCYQSATSMLWESRPKISSVISYNQRGCRDVNHRPAHITHTYAWERWLVSSWVSALSAGLPELILPWQHCVCCTRAVCVKSDNGSRFSHNKRSTASRDVMRDLGSRYPVHNVSVFILFQFFPVYLGSWSFLF